MNSVYVEYDGGLDAAKDAAINEAAGYTGDGIITCDSGCMLSEPFTRDMVFRYGSSAAAAVAAAELIKMLPDVRVKTQIEQ